MRQRPTVFIGSSSEGLKIAQYLELLLDSECEVKLWNQGVFGLGFGTLESLVLALDEFDFAILVLTPDDMTLSRGEQHQSPRDNLLFELGLFMGSLGRNRTFIVFDRTASPKLPSDLAGVIAATFEPHSNGDLRAALGAPATEILERIRKLSFREALRVKQLTQATQEVQTAGNQIQQATQEVQSAGNQIQLLIQQQLHAAEYSAIMGRISMSMKAQYYLFLALPLEYVVLFVFRGQIYKPVFLWAAVLVFPFTCIVAQGILHEALYGLLFIESELRPLAARLAGTHLFWIHERVLHKWRGSQPIPVGYRFSPSIISLASVVGALAYRWRYGLLVVDFIGIYFSACLSLMLTLLIVRSLKLEAQIRKAADTPK